MTATRKGGLSHKGSQSLPDDSWVQSHADACVRGSPGLTAPAIGHIAPASWSDRLGNPYRMVGPHNRPVGEGGPGDTPLGYPDLRKRGKSPGRGAVTRDRPRTALYTRGHPRPPGPTSANHPVRPAASTHRPAATRASGHPRPPSGQPAQRQPRPPARPRPGRAPRPAAHFLPGPRGGRGPAHSP